ncbi:MAG: PQQ-binding-like beta-propeller repeat protein [Candidatus Omnitrophota bacterium]
MNNDRMKKNNSNKRYWDSSLKGIAVVSGVFSLLVAVLMIFNHAAIKAGLPDKEALYSEELVQKKAQLTQEPTNEQLIKEIRLLDLELRRDYFQRRDFARRGKYLLLVGIVIFIASLKSLASARKKPAKPKSRSKEPEFESHNRKLERRAVSVLGASILGGVLALNAMQRSETPFPASESQESSMASAVPAADYPSPEEIQKNWPRFRGPGGLGISAYDRAPAFWDGKTGEGVLWKTEILLPGNNSPIVWGDQVFISGADENKKEVFCYSMQSGELLWRSPVDNIPGNPGESPVFFEDTGRAPSTMACDGSRVYAIFPDGDLIAFHFNGQRAWAKNLGVPENPYGNASSLVLYQNLLLVQYDQGGKEDGKSMLYALEGKTGEIAWRSKRPVGSSWTTPIVIDVGKEKQLVTCSDPWIIAYEPGTGEELWKANLLGTDLAPSPIFAADKIFAIKSNEILYAIRPDGRGDVTDSPNIVWSKDCPAPDICSPVSNGELVFILGGGGYLTCYDVQTGVMVWEHGFDDAFQSSPSLAGGWIYLLSESGNGYRVKAAREYEESQKSFLDEWLRASPAFLDGKIVIRGDRNLYCIGDKS